MTTTRRSSGRERDPGRWPADTLAGRATAIEQRTEESPWADHEYVRGYGVLVLPFSAGDLLALRVAPQNPFAPYASVWHRSRGGEWSIFVDGPALETACPRYWGPVTRRTALASIEVTWTGPSTLRVAMDDPALEWTMTVATTPTRRLASALNAALPLWTWRRGPLLRAKEWLARRLLGVGDVQFGFTTPSDHDAVLVPEEEYVVDASEAVLEGRSLGEPVRLEANPTIGDVPLPTRPSFVIAQAHLGIADREGDVEYDGRTGPRGRGTSSAGDGS